jgi:uncharacterized alpha-E superfamily protein
MLSRTADHLFWMARYMERAGQARSACGEATTRLRASARGGVFGLPGEEHAV